MVKKIAKLAFPDYKGRKFFLETVSSPIDVRSYWDGGSRDYFNFIRLDTLSCFGEIPAQSINDKPMINADNVILPEGLACVRHSYFCGKDSGLTVMVCDGKDNQKFLEDNTKQPLTNTNT